VQNQTGIDGLFAIDTSGWVPMRQPPLPPPPSGAPSGAAPVVAGPPTGESSMSDPTRPTLFMVLRNLGLELKSQKGAIDVFVIDHIERPAAN
jgi:uncharacterized protein (TIGR03435 family)